MQSDQNPYGQSFSMTPPSQAAPLPAARSSWPVVLGIIAIVIAVLGLLTYGCGGIINVVWSLWLPSLQQSGALDPATQTQLDVARRYMPFTIAQTIIGSGLSILLLTAGIGLLRRRRWTVRAAIIWAVARIVWAIPQTIVGWMLMDETFFAMEQAMEESGQGGTPMPAGFFSVIEGFSAAMMACYGIIYLVLPVFMLMWFSRQTIREETSRWTPAVSSSPNSS